MNTTTTNAINFKITESHQSNWANTNVETNIENLNKLKTKINYAMHTNKPIIYLNVTILNKSCLEVLKIAKQCNVLVVFLNNKTTNKIEIKDKTPEFESSIKLRLEDGIRILKLKNIVRLQAVSNYTFFYTTLSTKPFISAKTLKFYDRQLGNTQFLRTHRSHLVNKAFIQSYIPTMQKKLVLTTGDEVEISRRKLATVLKNMKPQI